jgi:hypothetical protein
MSLLNRMKRQLANVRPIIWRFRAATLQGMRGPREVILARVSGMGFVTVPDTSDNELIYFARPGKREFAKRLVGEIRGREMAVVKITAELQ